MPRLRSIAAMSDGLKDPVPYRILLWRTVPCDKVHDLVVVYNKEVAEQGPNRVDLNEHPYVSDDRN
jgi:hypothetical protein